MLVRDVGPPDASIMLVGEAPGATEDTKGLPFSGSSGKLLKHMLSHSGLTFDSCYVTNVINQRPPRNDFSTLYLDKGRKRPSPQLETAWLDLQNKIRTLKPKVVITLGGEALRALTNKHGIENWRGCPIPFESSVIVPTYHPAAVMREYSLHVIVELDLAKAKRLSKTGLVLREQNFILQPSTQDVETWFSGLRPGQKISFDLESIGQRVRCIGFATQESAICVPFLVMNNFQPTNTEGSSLISVGETSGCASNYWTLEQEVQILTLISKFFSNPDIEKVGQNSICFDEPFLTSEFKFSFAGHKWDIMHMFHLLYPELPKGLDFFCSIYTDYPNYWTGKNSSVDREEWIYNLWDCRVTLDVFNLVMEELAHA